MSRIYSRVCSSPYVGALTVCLSIAAAVGFLGISFGFAHVVAAVALAHLWPLTGAVAMGALVQVVRAERARQLLSKDRTATLGHTYAALTVGHGLGDLAPVVPGGLILRCALTERLSHIPIGFSAGVFMLEGMLDGLGLSLLIVYLLLAVTLTGWMHVLLLAALAQCSLLLVVSLASWALSRRSEGTDDRTHRLSSLRRLGSQLATGLGAFCGRGPRVAVYVLAFSLLVTLVEGVQLVLFMNAFALTPAFGHVLLILVLMLAGNSIPIKIPGSGTVMAAGALAMADIHGPGLAGYIVVSRVVWSSETTLLALAILGWWSGVKRLRATDRAQRSPLRQRLSGILPGGSTVKLREMISRFGSRGRRHRVPMVFAICAFAALVAAVPAGARSFGPISSSSSASGKTSAVEYASSRGPAAISERCERRDRAVVATPPACHPAVWSRGDES